MKPSISILGCGWLGYPLALELIKAGYIVKGSSRSEKRIELMKQKHIEAYQLSFDPIGKGKMLNEFFNSKVIIIAIPPSTSKHPSYFHPNQIMNIKDYMIRAKVEACIYISSTAAYPDVNGMVNENTMAMSENERSFAILQAEKILRESPVPTAIVRCGGLMGYDRNPINYLAYLMHEHVESRKPKKRADTPVNYVHRDDVIGIIKNILQKEYWGEIFNAVAPEHPLRREIIQMKYPYSIIVDDKKSEGSFKIVDGSKVKVLLDYEYKYPNPLNFPFSTLG
jgi:nucleoside-diphosphate-sugar epimerase